MVHDFYTTIKLLMMNFSEHNPVLFPFCCRFCFLCLSFSLLNFLFYHLNAQDHPHVPSLVAQLVQYVSPSPPRHQYLTIYLPNINEVPTVCLPHAELWSPVGTRPQMILALWGSQSGGGGREQIGNSSVNQVISNPEAEEGKKDG